jgi:predicted nucleic acid-binding protein
MKVLLDTNIVLDLLLDREPFSANAQHIYTKIENKEIEGFLCPTSLTTLFYLLNKHLSTQKSHETLEAIVELFDVVAIDKKIMIESLKNSGSDFEDSAIYTSANFANMDFIITRDKRGFKKSKVTTLSPEEFLIRAQDMLAYQKQTPPKIKTN